MTGGDVIWVVAGVGVLAWLNEQRVPVERRPRPDEPDDSEADR